MNIRTILNNVMICEPNLITLRKHRDREEMQIALCHIGHMEQLLWAMLIPALDVVSITSLDISLTIGARVNGRILQRRNVWPHLNIVIGQSH